MIITTITQNDENQITSCSLFDTQTGIKYQLVINRGDFESVKVFIESAHTISIETGYPGVSYWEDEAVDFWRQLIEVVPTKTQSLTDDSLHAASVAVNDRKIRRNVEALKKGEPSQLDEIEIPF